MMEKKEGDFQTFLPLIDWAILIRLCISHDGSITNIPMPIDRTVRRVLRFELR
jgi:hypothetical protein